MNEQLPVPLYYTLHEFVKLKTNLIVLISLTPYWKLTAYNIIYNRCSFEDFQRYFNIIYDADNFVYLPLRGNPMLIVESRGASVKPLSKLVYDRLWILGHTLKSCENFVDRGYTANRIIIQPGSVWESVQTCTECGGSGGKTLRHSYINSLARARDVGKYTTIHPFASLVNCSVLDPYATLGSAIAVKTVLIQHLYGDVPDDETSDIRMLIERLDRLMGEISRTISAEFKSRRAHNLVLAFSDKIYI